MKEVKKSNEWNFQLQWVFSKTKALSLKAVKAFLKPYQ